MRKILIVGAGQSGLHLAHGLLTHGYDVTVITSQTSTEIRTGRPSLTQFTYPTILEFERELELDFWSAQAPHIEAMKLHVYPPGTTEPVVEIGGRHQGYAVSVDRRVKMADWLEYFEDRGGKVVIHGISVTDLDYFARMFDLIVVAVGHGELGALFEPDPHRFSGARPRIIAQALVDGVAPDPDADPETAWIGASADAGQPFIIPMLSEDGPCTGVFISEWRNGVIDSWPERMRPDQQWDHMCALLRDYLPKYYERVSKAELIDGRSVTLEALRPQVRKPVGVLPSGGRVLGIADVVITSDPSAAQGWNHSSRCAKSYLESIVAHGDRPFDETFMVQTFESFWTYGYYAELWAETVSSFWDGPPPQQFQDVFAAAPYHPEIGDRWVHGWDNPLDFHEWLLDPVKAQAYLDTVTSKQSA
ncbi:styrene monooxygenase/indole monooxygenase family protein [Lipingzhangella sp. LS1_29]|uniref:Styrene monooxygenase/indole monooxygenase family protein n=1 Tax=Lipingzhangella rawalii TaxID=2055835 RepID=A0ABU2H8V3_9ACTN|nr:styrene monooxygenase/indole monooxygenase family protein [Lipingzhangella rawalii]MDS1271713.1 styrene monooxygenase/indole monooxygenase family protein [Lipingzhangella rawalii]